MNINGRPALRIDDIGMHMACCGTNMWTVVQASGQVFVNGARIVRKGDATQHCGGRGQMIEASGNVIDNSPIFHEAMPGNPDVPALPRNQVLVFPKFEPFCDADAPPGLPTFGNPQVYNQGAQILKHLFDPPEPRPLSKNEQWRIENTPHVSEAPPSQYDDVEGAKARLEAAKAELEAIVTGTDGWQERRERARESINRAMNSYDVAVAHLEQEELDKESREAVEPIEEVGE